MPGPAADRHEFRQGFLTVLDEIWRLINQRNDLQHFQQGFFIWDVPTFNERVVREAVLNAVSHRDYRHGGSVFVRQYPRRIEIVSPGGFPPGITPDNILRQQNPRNRRIAEVLGKCGLDRETNKELLLKHIRDNRKEGSQLRELRQVLPALSRDQVQSLLRGLKSEGRIYKVGATRAARWYPG